MTLRYFDLNTEKVLDTWAISSAIREVIANAVDEMHMSGSEEPTITVEGDEWVIRDYGRGLHTDHLTQNQNPAKANHPNVIGQFGVGLKDALAVFHRHGVSVCVRSPHGTILRTEIRPKADFPDQKTLHAVVAPSTDPVAGLVVGTEFRLGGVTKIDMDEAKESFLRYNGDRVLETTKYGEVLAKADDAPGRVYVRGLLVAEEPDFLFSYNITDLDKALRDGLNRERRHVGRTAYRNRVQRILLECREPTVAGPLVDDFSTIGVERRAELHWDAVCFHACRILATHEAVVFARLGDDYGPLADQARAEGKQIIVVPPSIEPKLHNATDLDGNPIMTLESYHDDYSRRFTYVFVSPADLTQHELVALDAAAPTLELAGMRAAEIPDIRIAETLQLQPTSHASVIAADDDGAIVVKRSLLGSPAEFLGAVLLGAVHAVDGSVLDGYRVADRAGIMATRALGLRTGDAEAASAPK